MKTQTDIQAINWETFNGSVTVLSPLTIETKRGCPSVIDHEPGGSRHIFEVRDGVFSHLVNGKEKAFARMIGGKLEKLSIGYRDTIGDFIVVMMFPEVLSFRGEVEWLEGEIEKPSMPWLTPIVISDRLRELARRETPSGVDVTDYDRHYFYGKIRDLFAGPASLADIRFIVRPKV